MTNVAVKNLKIVLGKNVIIENLNLDVVQGEFIVLLGPSGCGKSTLLHSIAGLIDVSDGSVEIAGRDVTWADPKDRSIGMVFQNYALYPTMTVEKNLSFGLRIGGMAKNLIKTKVTDVARLLQLTELLDRKPSQLSGGQRQRVAIGRALVREVGVFLLDEPLSNLDAKLRSELRRELKLLHAQLGATMIYVTHDQIEAMTLASRIAVMRSGKIQQLDSPDMIYHKPLNMFVAGFLGSPSMNFVHGKLELNGDKVLFKSRTLTLDMSGYAFQAPPITEQACVLGVRPEDISLKSLTDDCDARMKVDLVEPMGSMKIVWVAAEGARMAIQTDASLQIAREDSAAITLQRHEISLFDAATELRL
jgi:multiple sugar transport system ATP-binding protein